jgi:integrase/recombinase XerD
VWGAKDMKHILIIKTLLLTGVRVTELVNIKIHEVDLIACNIKISHGKGGKDRVVPFSPNFKELLAFHIRQYKQENREYLFESDFRRHYTDRGVRKILMRYTKLAGITKSISPHTLRHFLFTWLKKRGIDDALIQPYSGHEKRGSLEIYSRLSLSDAQEKYNEVINDFPV